ncbi:ArsR/SmtB family transcription factor [Natrarchaeobius sp. A-rgal3]|uniref:ArsR/SmtB family transcription factor n=1 Tax=Natrarchaeobius versutus TaxID=1679078 RepID=UPI00351055EC
MDRLAGRLVRRLREDEPDEPTVVGLEGEDADQLFDALGSETSRAVLAACYEEGRARSELADELETSLQNVGYHVDKLESAGLLEAVETRYGENGREVTVYEPTKRAIVVAAGEPGLVERLTEAVDRLFAPIAFVGLIALVVGVLARGPARIGMLASDDATRVTTETSTISPVTATVAATFVLGLIVVLAADRQGVFDRTGERCVRHSGVGSTLFGRRGDSTRRHVVSSVGIALVTFLALDLVAVGTGHRLSVLAWLVVQLAIPAGVLAAAATAYANDGVAVSWATASAALVGVWGYLVAGELVRGGLETMLVVIGVAAIAIVGVPLGSVAYFGGRAVAAWRGRGSLPSRRTMAVLLCQPPVTVLVFVGWFRLVM